VLRDSPTIHLHTPAVIGRITADARIVPIWMSAGLIAPEPWSPWLSGSDRAIALSGTTARATRDLALVG
jgi:hypothetical protein